MRQLLLFIFTLSFSIAKSECIPGEFVLVSPENKTHIYLHEDSDYLLKWAVQDLVSSIEEISGKKIPISYLTAYNSNLQGIFVGVSSDSLMIKSSLPNVDTLKNSWEKFQIVEQGKNLFVVGSDLRGTVYALFAIAEKIGISPWQWWADVTPSKQQKIALNIPENGWIEEPSVKFRGIFLNDEDFGLQPWAAKTFEPETGDIGPRTYEKIFQLLLRLKANTIWPAMHKSTQSFFNIYGNKEMAEKYHIYVGTSHAEPMLRNNVDEWDKKQYGPFNYFDNKERVKEYWRNRVKEAQNGNYIFTMGMRGIHDSGMQGNKSLEEKVQALHQIFEDQNKMLSEILNKPLHSIPRVFIPYKEVLELYNNGLKVPDNTTVMWTDDNYGYIRRLDTTTEQEQRESGIYYHLSYWGRPHDYLWLSSTQPGLIWYEMSRAYQNGARNIWIANVGDIKPAEYTMEFFLDLAWNIDSIQKNTIKNHLSEWAQREFSKEAAKEIAAVMNEYYRLAFLRKPEFMGWSQTEPNTSATSSEFTHLNNDELQRRIDAYLNLMNSVDKISKKLPSHKLDAYFQLVEYPVKAAAYMNFKFLEYQKHLETKKEAYQKSAQNAYDSIGFLTKKYNQLNNGKWNFMMVMDPRKLSAYQFPNFQKQDISDISETPQAQPISIQSNDYLSSHGKDQFTWSAIEGLGYSGSAVTLFPFDNYEFEGQKPYLEYEFGINQAGSYEIEIRCLPTHANNFDFKIGVQLEDGEIKEFPINTKGRSEEWKTNVLRNAVQVNCPASFNVSGNKKMKLYVSHTGIVIDQIAVHPKDYPDYYEIRSE